MWTIGFETPPGNPLPYYEISGSNDFVLEFAERVIAQGWTATVLRWTDE